MEDRLSVAVVTFGCQMNKSRSEHLLHLFLQDGFSEAQEEEEADVLVFNTCAVREHAVTRAVGVIAHLYHAALQRRGKPPCVVLCGCMSELLREELLVRLPYVRVLTGTHNIDELPPLFGRPALLGNGRLSSHLPRRTSPRGDTGGKEGFPLTSRLLSGAIISVATVSCHIRLALSGASPTM